MSNQPGRWGAVCGKYLRAPFQAVGTHPPLLGPSYVFPMRVIRTPCAG